MMKHKLIQLIAFLFVLPIIGFSQKLDTTDLDFDVLVVFPTLSINSNDLAVAETLLDINQHYKPDWVKKYLSVEITTINNGKTVKTKSQSDTFSKEQKERMISADSDSYITAKINYIPKNNLKDNEPKELDFAVYVNPKNDAIYPGGEKQLKKYLKNALVDKIPLGSIRQYNIAAVNFTIAADGRIINPEMEISTDDKALDNLFLEAICEMESWKPAEFADGKRIDQHFTVMVGDMYSCSMNLLNLRDNPLLK